jgi:hypothetical protein
MLLPLEAGLDREVQGRYSPITKRFFDPFGSISIFPSCNSDAKGVFGHARWFETDAEIYRPLVPASTCTKRFARNRSAEALSLRRLFFCETNSKSKLLL